MILKKVTNSWEYLLVNGMCNSEEQQGGRVQHMTLPLIDLPAFSYSCKEEGKEIMTNTRVCRNRGDGIEINASYACMRRVL